MQCRPARSRRHVDLHHRHEHQPGDAFAGTGQAHDRAVDPRAQGGRQDRTPIVMLTAYTMRMAQLLDPHCDILLVGDSLGQVIYGLPSTIPVTMEMMCAHGAAVVRGSWHALVGGRLAVRLL